MKRKNKHKYMTDIIGEDREFLMKTRQSQENKISQVFLDFAKPLSELYDSDDECEKALSLSLFCWNLCLESTDEQEKRIKSLFDRLQFDLEERIEYNFLIQKMLERKRTLFPHDDRYILSYKITEKGGRKSITVATLADTLD